MGACPVVHLENGGIDMNVEDDVKTVGTWIRANQAPSEIAEAWLRLVKGLNVFYCVDNAVELNP